MVEEDPKQNDPDSFAWKHNAKVHELKGSVSVMLGNIELISGMIDVFEYERPQIEYHLSKIVDDAKATLNTLNKD